MSQVFRVVLCVIVDENEATTETDLQEKLGNFLEGFSGGDAKVSGVEEY
jgi:hypothetical protein